MHDVAPPPRLVAGRVWPSGRRGRGLGVGGDQRRPASCLVGSLPAAPVAVAGLAAVGVGALETRPAPQAPELIEVGLHAERTYVRPVTTKVGGPWGCDRSAPWVGWGAFDPAAWTFRR